MEMILCFDRNSYLLKIEIPATENNILSRAGG